MKKKGITKFGDESAQSSACFQAFMKISLQICGGSPGDFPDGAFQVDGGSVDFLGIRFDCITRFSPRLQNGSLVL
jgi:hypothetical protein